ncbi:pyridine nucleotide-disulfide oxidoreductase-like protein [Amniculicola lignicola CBS 123094]|uniref:Pyridine nucleotide-disulfide oxidoreductase-like protein n=1 Tax=Amniculicola lignicola CBS 123094 TaxID=1392246 RepID=A0A6A5X3Z0_9PLEO|nr:pyridine nucleotide-disulfide oxidoreductase-like protein [Amniculicola lignicola CBS 123094]
MSAELNVSLSGQGYNEEGVPGVNLLHVQERYGEERAKRLRADGNSQFIEPSLDGKFKSFLGDPWIDPSTIQDAETMFPDNRCQLLILGAGWGGLLFAIRMVQAGLSPSDIRIVDTAGGWGGTWYWNRYPGLTCDIESYCYLPLLEETGYIPKHRYSSGEEIREYANFAAQQWGLTDSAVFQTKAEEMVWDEEQKEWQVELTQKCQEIESKALTVRANFVATVNGVLNWPKLPSIPGLSDYRGAIFHSSRWNYTVTGGTSADPSLAKLKGKRVAIIGTGATAVQIIPHLARWAEHVYVVQRTPSAVDEQEQWETNRVWFEKEVASSQGWQRERLRNFHHHFTTKEQPTINLVGDKWTSAVTMAAVSGNKAGPKSIDELPSYLETLHRLDAPRQDRIRKRVEAVVEDPITARNLQAWCPTWCKRPVFHDEYLKTFNCKNVTLVDTGGKGLDRITVDSIVSGDNSYPVDLIICATGFRAPFVGSPAEKANMTIIGTNGVSMSDEWGRSGPSTQHGVLDANFPNLFLSGPWQAALSPNNLFNIDVLAKHAAYILAQAKAKAGGHPFVVATTAAAAEDWGTQILTRSAPLMAIFGCTPSYFNGEGGIDRIPPDSQVVMARSGLWGHGIEDFGNMRGIEVHM